MPVEGRLKIHHGKPDRVGVREHERRLGRHCRERGHADGTHVLQDTVRARGAEAVVTGNGAGEGGVDHEVGGDVDPAVVLAGRVPDVVEVNKIPGFERAGDVR